MINRKNLWFLTLFSLVLVLSVYYITMPNELLVSNNGENIDNIKVKESNIIETLKQEDNNNTLSELNKLIEQGFLQK